MMRPLAVLAAGGTGGHMFPAQALAEELIARGWRVHLFSDQRAAQYVEHFPDAVAVCIIRSASFARGGIMQKIRAPFTIATGILRALRDLRIERPDVIIGFGGYPALPTLVAGGTLKIPRIIHEQNAVLGRVNRWFAKRASAVVYGLCGEDLPVDGNAMHLGNPVRQSIIEKARSDYIAPGDWPLDVLVIGGSQGASLVAQTAARAIGALDAPLCARLRVSCQTRDADHDSVAAIFAQAGVRVELAPFFDDIAERMSQAQLVISRAGASTIADLSVIGRPAILIPLAIATNDHQTKNAHGLTQAQAAEMISEHDLTVEGLCDKIADILCNSDLASAMAAAALRAGKPNATSDLANLVEKITKEH